MKIYKNPEGNFDLLYPSLFFGSIGLIFFLWTRTIISSIELLSLLGFSMVFCFFAYYLIAKRWKLFAFEHVNLFLATTATPMVLALVLLLNYIISVNIYHNKMLLDDYLKYSFSHQTLELIDEKAPKDCEKFFEIYDIRNIDEANYVLVKIDEGIFGFKVLKHKIFSED